MCVLLITYVVQAFKVQGTSMSPELLDGERILVNKFLYRFTMIDVLNSSAIMSTLNCMLMRR